MATDINPQFPYYVALFALTLILRGIRTYRSRPKGEMTADQKRQYMAKYVFFGFELVNVSAGVFILLSEHATKFVATVMIIYVILVILSFSLEDDDVGLRVKTVGHLAVSAAVFGVTYYAFFHVDGIRSKANASADMVWRVAIPYIDQSLLRNFGVKSELLHLSYVVEVQANDREKAQLLGKERFWSDDGPKPFLAKAEKTHATFILLESEAVAELK
jgi:hypothetical protein